VKDGACAARSSPFLLAVSPALATVCPQWPGQAGQGACGALAGRLNFSAGCPEGRAAREAGRGIFRTPIPRRPFSTLAAGALGSDRPSPAASTQENASVSFYGGRQLQEAVDRAPQFVRHALSGKDEAAARPQSPTPGGRNRSAAGRVGGQMPPVATAVPPLPALN
jgi:hypothetical protein